MILRGLAKRRMKRIATEALSNEAKRALFNATTAIDLSAAKDIIAEYKHNAIEAKTFERVKFIFEDIAFDTTKKKHIGHVNGFPCDGKINDFGKCYKCNEDNAQFKVVYGFKAVLHEINNESIILSVTCGPGAGRSMFGMEASEFAKLSDSQMLDKIEELSGVPMVAGMIIAHDPDKNDTFVCIYDINKLDV